MHVRALYLLVPFNYKYIECEMKQNPVIMELFIQLQCMVINGAL